MGSAFVILDKAAQNFIKNLKLKKLNKYIPSSVTNSFGKVVRAATFISVLSLYTSVYLTAYQAMITLANLLFIPTLLFNKVLFKDFNKVVESFKAIFDNKLSLSETPKLIKNFLNTLAQNTYLDRLAMYTAIATMFLINLKLSLFTLFMTPPLYVTILSLGVLSYAHNPKKPSALLFTLRDSLSESVEYVKNLLVPLVNNLSNAFSRSSSTTQQPKPSNKDTKKPHPAVKSTFSSSTSGLFEQNGKHTPTAEKVS